MGEIGKGAAVVVARGRKVPVGTKGVVQWIGEGRWGTRVGLAVEGEAKLVYTAFANVDLDESPEGKAAEEAAAAEKAAWIAAKEAEGKVRKAEAEALLPFVKVAKGDIVTPREGRYAGVVCRVLWVGANKYGLRVGVAPKPGRPRFEAGRPVWPRYEADWLPLSAVTDEIPAAA